MVFVLVLHLLLLNTVLAGYCRSGEEGCSYECHCQKSEECNGGICPSGCKVFTIDNRTNYGWSGPGCQIGNVGFNKSANMTSIKLSHERGFPAGAALDGDIGPYNMDHHCSHPSNHPPNPAEWLADLGNLYTVYNITLYNRRDCCPDRLSKFDLTVYNTPDDEHLCGHRTEDIPKRDGSTVTCNSPVSGRYVHFKRTGGPDIEVSQICEMVITGHRHYDCSRCPDGVDCNTTVGCSKCYGSYQPECSPECHSGWYGTNCDSECGHCKQDDTCDVKTGDCPAGCMMWWTGDRCDSEIVVPVFGTETIRHAKLSGRGVTISWDELHSVSYNLARFYGYKISHQVRGSNEYKEDATIPHPTSGGLRLSWTYTDLAINTLYDIRVNVFRTMAGKEEIGTGQLNVQFKTKCVAPERPEIIKLERIDGEQHLPNITVHFKRPSVLEPNCDRITNMNLTCWPPGSVPPTVSSLSESGVHTMVPNTVGEYRLQIAATNNEGYRSESDNKHIIIQAPNKQFGATILSIIFGCLVIVLIIALTVVMCRRRGLICRKGGVNGARSDGKNKKTGEILPSNTTVSVAARAPRPAPRTKPRGLIGSVEPRASPVHKALAPEPIEQCEVPAEVIYANNVFSTTDFERYVARAMTRINDLFREYESLPKADLSRCRVAVLPGNRNKNRFRDIYPYDEARVVLAGDTNEEQNFVHASYITGYNMEREYIATQGPKRSTLVDFWSMVWEQGCNRIVMLANVTEMGKPRVEPYWPGKRHETKLIGPYKVKTEATEMTADYLTRIMTIQKKGECRTVRQFHFTTWEDKGKPIHGVHTLLAFLTKVHSVDQYKKGPMIVHCSAGIGRTGTFIALDILQDMVTKKKKVPTATLR